MAGLKGIVRLTRQNARERRNANALASDVQFVAEDGAITLNGDGVLVLNLHDDSLTEETTGIRVQFVDASLETVTGGVRVDVPELRLPVASIDDGDSPYSVGNSTNQIVLVDASSGSVTIDLPAAVSGKWLLVKRLDDSTNNVQLVPDGAEEIDAETELNIESQNDAVQLVGLTGTGWYIV